MDDFERGDATASSLGERDAIIADHFIESGVLDRDDIAERQARLARVVSAEIVPRLMLLHIEVLKGSAVGDGPSEEEIGGLAHLVLSPDIEPAAAYVVALRERGLSMDALFVALLEPAARYLGSMWDRDDCDFIDVTLGVARLQKLLAIFNCTHDIPALGQKRRVLLTTAPGEQHCFGMAMVEKFLRAGGWFVQSEPARSVDDISAIVRTQWFPVIGMTASTEPRMDVVRDAIQAIRSSSCNPAIGVMVGGAPFAADPGLAARVGADATATTAPASVILAQKLFDLSVAAEGPGH